MAGLIGTTNTNKRSLLPANVYTGDKLKASSIKLFKVSRTNHFSITFLIGDSQAAGYPGRMYVAAISRDTNGNINASINPLLGSIYHKIKYRVNADNTIDVVLYRTQYSPVVGCFILSGNMYVSDICTEIEDSEVDESFVNFTGQN